MDWAEWESLLDELEGAFPGKMIGEATQAWVCACRRCCVYLEEPAPEGGRFVTRVAGAASVLAPLYVVYVTTQTIYSRTRDTRPQITFEPTGEVKLYADKLGQLIERVLGYHPFPMELANVPLPDIRVSYLNLDTPTLLNALLSDSLK